MKLTESQPQEKKNIMVIQKKKKSTVRGNSFKSVLFSYLSQGLQGNRSSHGLCVFLIGTWCLGLVIHTVHCDLNYEDL